MSAELARMLQYDIWANGATLESLRQATPPAQSLRWIAHIIGAEHLWLARILGRTSPLPVWPDLTMEECTRELKQLSSLWQEYIPEPDPAVLARQVPYTNSKSEEWTSTVEDILTHVTIHSAYHRGQIASDLRAAGLTPAYTDFIHAVRQGFIG
jgi:uncharacterized damage-inducible protein DinB